MSNEKPFDGRELIAIRKANKWTQGRLGSIIGASNRQIGHWECGVIPTNHYINRMNKLLGTNFALKPEKSPPPPKTKYSKSDFPMKRQGYIPVTRWTDSMLFCYNTKQDCEQCDNHKYTIAVGRKCFIPEAVQDGLKKLGPPNAFNYVY